MPYIPVKVLDALLLRLESGADYGTSRGGGLQCLECFAVTPRSHKGERMKHRKDCTMLTLDDWAIPIAKARRRQKGDS